jgi:hypothetical protein
MNGLGKERLNFRSLVISLLIILGILALVSYVTFQARFLIEGPSVTLLDEPNNVQNDKIIHLKGRAFNITKITLDGQQIFTDKSGYFDEALMLENGYTIVTIAATDRYGREKDVVRQFVYTPTSIMPE